MGPPQGSRAKGEAGCAGVLLLGPSCATQMKVCSGKKCELAGLCPLVTAPHAAPRRMPPRKEGGVGATAVGAT
jgi:hypothetical protein